MPKIETDLDIAIADLAIALEVDDDDRLRKALTSSLDQAYPLWREGPIVERVRAAGAVAAAEALVRKFERP